MNRSWLLLFGVFAIALAVWAVMRKPDSSTVEPEPSTLQSTLPSKMVSPKVVTAKPSKRPPTVGTTETATEESDPEEERRIVPFIVDDGLAIAHGDIILGAPEQSDVTEGNYRLPELEYWEKPEIPFGIDPAVPEPNRVIQATKHIESKTGLKFVAYDGHKDAIIFQPGKEHCQSTLGKQGGLQAIRIAQACTWHEITHEILHAIGFIHEQSRSDRDGYVEVIWDNIKDAFKSQFDILPTNMMGPSRGTNFDYQSIMLYDPSIFVKQEGLANMKSKTRLPIAPSSEGLSAGDIQRIKSLFHLD